MSDFLMSDFFKVDEIADLMSYCWLWCLIFLQMI